MLRLAPWRADSTAFSIAAIVAVVAFGAALSKTHAVTHLDLLGVKALNTVHTGFFGKLGSLVYTAFSPVEAVLLTILTVVTIWLVSRNIRLAATFAVTVAVTWLSSDIVKLLIDRSRPDRNAFPNHLAQSPVDPSYPSGHMAFIVALAVSFAFLSRGKPYRWIVVIAGILVSAFVAVCLVSDGVHYPTDVFASMVWSLGVAPLVLGL